LFDELKINNLVDIHDLKTFLLIVVKLDNVKDIVAQQEKYETKAKYGGFI